MSAQENEALVYYAGSDVEDQADWEKEASNEESERISSITVITGRSLQKITSFNEGRKWGA